VVEHESVDPKAQGKPDLGKGVILTVLCRCCCCFFAAATLLGARLLSGAARSACGARIYARSKHPQIKPKGNPVLIPEPSCGYVREIALM
jgi:hypothetical protein